MSWWTYVEQTSSGDSPKGMQAHTGIDGPNFSRWKTGHVPKPDMVAKFARAYGRPVLEAFVAAGFLTEAEARMRPAAAPSLDSLTDDQLIDELRERVRRHAAPNTRAGVTPANEGGPRPPVKAKLIKGKYLDVPERLASDRDRPEGDVE